MEKFFNHLPAKTLRGKFLTFHIPITLIVLICVFIAFAVADYKQALEDFNARLDSVMENSKDILGIAVATNQKDLQYSIAKQLLEDPYIVAVIVYDKNDKQLHALTEVNNDDPKYLTERFNQIFHNKEFVGGLKIMASSKFYLHKITSRLLFDLYLSLIVVLTVTLGALIVNRYTIDTPLSRLLRAIELTRSTHINYTVNWDSKDEVGRVIAAFNEMQIQLQKQTEVLTVAKEQAVAGNKVKDQFIANISHELRTPMHTILGLSKLGLKKSLTWSHEQIQDAFKDIVNSSQRLLSLVNELLDLAKLESGKITFDFKAHNFLVAIESVVKEIAPLSDEKEIIINLNIDQNYNYNAVFDYVKICQVLNNLLTNAIKFTPKCGSITIKTHTDQANNIVCSISDTGIGIAEVDLNKLFDKFFQGTKPIHNQAGYGLGLAICKEIIMYHHGDIFARNNPQGGATFTFTLPKKQN